MDAKRTDEGEIKCLVENRAGKIQKSAYLKVRKEKTRRDDRRNNNKEMRVKSQASNQSCLCGALSCCRVSSRRPPDLKKHQHGRLFMHETRDQNNNKFLGLDIIR